MRWPQQGAVCNCALQCSSAPKYQLRWSSLLFLGVDWLPIWQPGNTRLMGGQNWELSTQLCRRHPSITARCQVYQTDGLTLRRASRGSPRHSESHSKTRDLKAMQPCRESSSEAASTPGPTLFHGWLALILQRWFGSITANQFAQLPWYGLRHYCPPFQAYY
jgi:hypothetical protein